MTLVQKGIFYLWPVCRNIIDCCIFSLTSVVLFDLPVSSSSSAEHLQVMVVPCPPFQYLTFYFSHLTALAGLPLLYWKEIVKASSDVYLTSGGTGLPSRKGRLLCLTTKYSLCCMVWRPQFTRINKFLSILITEIFLQVY